MAEQVFEEQWENLAPRTLDANSVNGYLSAAWLSISDASSA